MSDWAALSFASPSSRDLCVEMERAASAFNFVAAFALLDLGMSQRDLGRLTGAGEIGRGRVEVGKGGLYQPIGNGPAPSIILPIMDGGELADLLAFSPRSPDSWALRRGEGWLLGAENIPKSGDWESGERKVHIYANPLEWLLAGAQGLCILSWDARAMRALANLGHDLTLIADSAALAAHIEQELSAVQRLPRVTFETGLSLEVAA